MHFQTIALRHRSLSVLQYIVRRLGPHNAFRCDGYNGNCYTAGGGL